MDFSELTDWPEYLKIFVGLLAMVDPVGVLPIFVSGTRTASGEDRATAARIAALTLFGILVVFAFLGDAVLDVFGIDLAAFQIAGGIVLLATALRLILGGAASHADGEPTAVAPRTFGVVPIGVPMLAGPAAISSVVVFSNEHVGTSHDIVLALVVLVIAITVWSLLRAAGRIADRLAGAAMEAATRVFGLIVAAVGVEFIVHGLGAHFPAWGGT